MWDLPRPGIKPRSTPVSYIGRQILYHWATREALEQGFEPRKSDFIKASWKKKKNQLVSAHFPSDEEMGASSLLRQTLRAPRAWDIFNQKKPVIPAASLQWLKHWQDCFGAYGPSCCWNIPLSPAFRPLKPVGPGWLRRQGWRGWGGGWLHLEPMFPSIFPYMVEGERVRITSPNPAPSPCFLPGKENKQVLELDTKSPSSSSPP